MLELSIDEGRENRNFQIGINKRQFSFVDWWSLTPKNELRDEDEGEREKKLFSNFCLTHW